MCNLIRNYITTEDCLTISGALYVCQNLIDIKLETGINLENIHQIGISTPSLMSLEFLRYKQIHKLIIRTRRSFKHFGSEFISET